MRQLWTKLFPRRCPICRTEVRRGSAGAVRAMGIWCCSQAHADAYECRLYEALDAFQRRHAARHWIDVPQRTASTTWVCRVADPAWHTSAPRVTCRVEAG
jgi:hypothetical protein